MPFAPELFSAPTLQGLLDKYRRERLRSVRFFDGLLTGELDALVESFAGVPEVHHPVRGRIKGERAFRRFVTDTTSWLTAHKVTVEDVDLLLTDARGVEEVVLHLDTDRGRVGLPFAIAADHGADERIIELRLYFSTLAADRPPREPLAAAPARPRPRTGPTSSASTSAPSRPATSRRSSRRSSRTATLREPAGGAYVHRGTDELRALYELFFSNGGGIPLEHCAVIDDGRACALEYNVVAWGRTELPPAGRAWPSTFGVTAASSPRRGSTTTPTRRWRAASGRTDVTRELLAAVDVVRRPGQGGVGHEVDGQRGDVGGSDDAPDRELGAELVARALRADRRGATPTAACRRSRRRSG